MTSKEVEEAVAYLEVWERMNNGQVHQSRILISKNDDFYLGRSHAHCRQHWADPSISNRHLRIHCLIWDESEAIGPLVYATDMSTNGTILTPSYTACQKVPSTTSSKIRLTRKSGAYLLDADDELRISANVSLIYRTRADEEYYILEDVQERETQLFSSRYTITNRTLGHGGGGMVFVAVHRKTNRQLACKMVNISGVLNPSNLCDAIKPSDNVGPTPPSTKAQDSCANEGSIPLEWFAKVKKALREFDIVKDLRHPNIITIEKVFWSMNSLYIFQELIPGGDLHSYIGAKGCLSDPETAVITRQILKAVEYLHDRGIVHRDLKPDNILMTSLDESARVVVTDFGGARIIPLPVGGKGPGKWKGRMFSKMGTIEYAAPEIFQQNRTIPRDQGYSASVDMWSVGCIVAVLLTGQNVFAGSENDNRTGIVQLLSECNLSILDSGEVWKHVGHRPKDFIRKLLVLHEDRRMTATQALAHPWFTNEHHAAAFDALYENTIRDWQPPRKVFKMVERLVPEITSHLGDNGLPKTFLPSSSSPNSQTISQGRRANTPLPTITEEHEMEHQGSSVSARLSSHPSVFASMSQLNIAPMEAASAGTQASVPDSEEAYTYVDLDDTDLDYGRQIQNYDFDSYSVSPPNAQIPDSIPETPPDAAIPDSIPETPIRGTKRRAPSFYGDIHELDFESQRSNGSVEFMAEKKFNDEVAKRSRIV
ncbi:kinase-like protein [Lophium mytilinum]|uniref:Kinase-like protein n=1 Tax=Lophium mytilinum TaxID=390894 RepID=A0A6A6Q8K1_9PEZI|nr:kinase-like protein [Lophium mytilinum]